MSLPSEPPHKPELPPNRRSSDPGTNPPFWKTLVWYLPVLLILLWLWQDVLQQQTVETISYSQFKEYLSQGSVTSVKIGESDITGVIDRKQASAKDTEKAAEAAKEQPSPSAPLPQAGEGSHEPPAESAKFNFRTIRVDDPDLVKNLQTAGVQFEGVQQSVLSQVLVVWLLPIVIITGLWLLLSRRLTSAGQAVMSIGKSRAKMIADRETGVTFADVAGCDEAKYELQEVVDFLKNPRRYEALGAKIPKGVLLIGPPGTGKTLMARAVAGEAHAPFFSLSGSDFVEMFVGVGAARVRDLFEQAKRQAPCIIFIDELDAIGRQRGVHLGPVNDEREQTLNQLLVEMDGFEANVGVIILAATNRPDVLDRALLRPGRFDRQVVVDSPDIDGRESILKVHSRGKPLAENVNLRAIAQGTVGFSGADLANTVNEAALLAARRGASIITQRDMEDAVEKLVAGPERTSRRLDAEEKRRVAYHEVGHALVAAYSKYADPVHKISIVPRGRAALGYTLQLPTGEQFLLTKSALLDRIKGLLGGRAAEEVVFGEVSTGAENDLARANDLARQMVCMFGMSDAVGLFHSANHQGGEFLPSMPGMVTPRDCSEATFHRVDEEVRKFLDDGYREAQNILRTHREQLDCVVEELLKRESLDAAAFNHLLGRPSESSRSPENNGQPVTEPLTPSVL